MADGLLPGFPLKTSLTPEELLELLERVARKTGVNIEHIEHLHIHIGEASMDSTKKTEGNITVGDITGSTVGSVGNARDINVFTAHVDSSTTMSAELKNELKAARAELEKSSLSKDDKGDVASNLDKLTEELNKPEAEREPGRVKRFLDRVKEVAPPVAALLSIAANIAKLAAG
jgi:hypothetical protein